MEDHPRRIGEMLDEGLRTAARAARRMAYVGFALLAFGFVLVGKIDARLVDHVRALIADITAPALDVFSYPLSVADDLLQDLKGFSNLREENRRLREENARLTQLRLAAHRLQQENASLRRLMRFDPGPVTRSISTRVIADTGGVFARSVMVHVGKAHGLRRGLAVIGSTGLVGRVQSLGKEAARVLLITDLNSKVPVAIGEGRLRAIMAGKNRPYPALEFFTSERAPTLGALVVTSGDGGVFPPDLPVGRVIATDRDQWRVALNSDLARLEFVRLLRYDPDRRIEEAGDLILSDPARAGTDDAADLR